MNSRFLPTLLLAVSCLSVQAQGTILFDNYVPGLVDARVHENSYAGIPLGSGEYPASWFQAQLWGGPRGGLLSPLVPMTTFKTSSAALMGYVNPVVVSVPGVNAGEEASVQLLVFDGDTWNTSLRREFSNFIDIGPLGGTLPDGTVLPPAILTGLAPFGSFIPEPNCGTLACIGLLALFLSKRFVSHRIRRRL